VASLQKTWCKKKDGGAVCCAIIILKYKCSLYIGIMDWKGRVFGGKYQPLISPELFKAVQNVLKHKSKRRKVRQGHNFPFCGLFHCSCGAMITAQWAKGHGGLYRYYRCTRKNGRCFEPYVQEKKVREQCLDVLRPLALTHDEADARSFIDNEAAKESQAVEVADTATADKLRSIQGKLNKLTQGYLDELIDGESYQAAKADLVLEKATLKSEIQRLRRTGTSSWIEPARDVINTLETLGKTDFAESLPEISRLVQKIGTNLLISRKTVSFSLAQPYDFVPPLLGYVRSPACEKSVVMVEGTSQSPVWCPRQDLNLYDVTH
jgi:hypothetical protein